MMDVDGIIPMDYLTVLSDKVEMVSRRIQKNLDSAPKRLHRSRTNGAWKFSVSWLNYIDLGL